MIFGKIITNGATSGRFEHPAIRPESVILLTLQRDVNEDITDLRCIQAGQDSGWFGWEINQGHDNPVSINYLILNY